nr:hypothetical protein [Streptomyces megasporus]
MFTDGIIEARDRNGVFFDPVPPLTGPLPPNPAVVLDTMLAALFRHARALEDDAAALAITHIPAGGAEQGPSSAPRIG